MLEPAAIHSHHIAPSHPVVWVSLINLQACGIGIAFGGSVVLALGLLGGARTFAMRMIRSGNSINWLNVQAAENRADAQTGVLALALGFAIQAGTTIWTVGHIAPALNGGWSYIVTIGWAAIPAALVWWADRKAKWFWVRRYLIRLARYDHLGAYNDRPDVRELTGYGFVLGEGREKHTDESDTNYLKRVWNLRHKHARLRD
jgi:hypothetical protein